jgi:uncharacterized RDD family membrane protein YckC
VDDPYAPPEAELLEAQTASLAYAGFWIRVGAFVIDTLLLLAFTQPLLVMVYGWEYYGLAEAGATGWWEYVVNWVVPAVAVIVFWRYKSATPGKMLLRVKIVDARSGGAPSTGQLIGRYFAYFVSTIPLGLGCFWVAWDERKQAWHDKLAHTLCVRVPR